MPRLTLLAPIAMALTIAPLMTIPAQATTPAQPAITFSGYTWSVKTSTGLVGPGPNTFSSDPANVSVDAQGRLRLAITRQTGGWASAEVINQSHLGYGTYSWTIDGDVGRLAPEAVLGLFTWSDDPSYANREIDVEFSKWGVAETRKTGWYAIQTGTFPTPLSRNFALRRATTSTHTFTWTPGTVKFTSSAAGRTTRWSSSGPDVPVPGDETPRVNLWLYQGTAPSAGSTSVIIRDFQFAPM